VLRGLRGLNVIELGVEQVISLHRVTGTNILPRRRGGKRINVSTLYRWASCGYRGVKQEVVRVGGTLCTSREALQRFCEALTSGNKSVIPTTTERRRRAVARSEKRLQVAGI
jgi:hypothetical protein